LPLVEDIVKCYGRAAILLERLLVVSYSQLAAVVTATIPVVAAAIIPLHLIATIS
jgi:hypothetical protein